MDILDNPWFLLAELIFVICVVVAYFRLCWRVKKILKTLEARNWRITNTRRPYRKESRKSTMRCNDLCRRDDLWRPCAAGRDFDTRKLWKTSVFRAISLPFCGFTFHSWRHFFRSALSRAGVADDIAKRLGGWTNDKTALRYDHDGRLSGLAEATAAAWRAASGGIT